MELMRYEPPLEEKLIDELVRYWEAIFECSYSEGRAMLAGGEVQHNVDTVYTMRDSEKLVGTCHLTVPRHDSCIGGLGEVATSKEYRGQGIAGKLCERALFDFAESGGEALFLGTANPAAAKVYEKLGWEKIDGANVYVNLVREKSIGRFYEDYYCSGEVRITPGDASQRIPLIPLIVYPHETSLLDANTDIYSTNYKTQESCMGLYPRYSKYEQNKGSAWFCAVDKNGGLAGLSTAKRTGGKCNVDGFVYPKHERILTKLLLEAIGWADRSCVIQAQAAANDVLKQSVFASLGFCVCCRYDLGDTTEVVVMEKAVKI